MKDLSMHIMDIAQNSIRAAANVIEIRIYENIREDLLMLTMKDNGTGMDKETVKKVADPFFTGNPTCHVGLGIPFLKQNAELAGGYFVIESEQNTGTIVKAIFSHSHIDCIPLGNVPQTIALLTAANPDIHFVYKHDTDKGIYIFDTQDVKKVLDEVPISHPDILSAIKEMITENEQILY